MADRTTSDLLDSQVQYWPLCFLHVLILLAGGYQVDEACNLPFPSSLRTMHDYPCLPALLCLYEFCLSHGAVMSIIWGGLLDRDMIPAATFKLGRQGPSSKVHFATMPCMPSNYCIIVARYLKPSPP